MNIILPNGVVIATANGGLCLGIGLDDILQAAANRGKIRKRPNGISRAKDLHNSSRSCPPITAPTF